VGRVNKIIEKTAIAESIHRFVIEAPQIARKRRAGNFVILRATETAERIPLTIVDADTERGTITLIVQGVGKTTRMLNAMYAGEVLSDVIGPLGHATPIEKLGTVVTMGGGVGTAEVLPIARALKAAGNRVISIIGARTRELLILEAEMRDASDELIIVTDDGSRGRRGLVIDPLKEMLGEGRELNAVYAIGPLVMMRAAARTTEPYKVKTYVSLNPVMIDGTGMCGGCRVTVGGRTRFACVDGPEFDGHEVDFDNLIMRNRAYQEQERAALERYEAAQTAAAEGLV
jgi:ferredoxin/flavodoxin---NADP+ reductase